MHQSHPEMLSAGTQTVDSSRLCSRTDIGKGGYAPGGILHEYPNGMQDIATMLMHCKLDLKMSQIGLVELTGDRLKRSLAKVPKQSRRNATEWVRDPETFHVALITPIVPETRFDKEVLNSVPAHGVQQKPDRGREHGFFRFPLSKEE